MGIISKFIAHAFVWDQSVRRILCSLGGDLFAIFGGHLLRFFLQNFSLPLAFWIVYVLLLEVKISGGDVSWLI